MVIWSEPWLSELSLIYRESPPLHTASFLSPLVGPIQTGFDSGGSLLQLWTLSWFHASRYWRKTQQIHLRCIQGLLATNTVCQMAPIALSFSPTQAILCRGGVMQGAAAGTLVIRWTWLLYSKKWHTHCFHHFLIKLYFWMMSLTTGNTLIMSPLRQMWTSVWQVYVSWCNNMKYEMCSQPSECRSDSACVREPVHEDCGVTWWNHSPHLCCRWNFFLLFHKNVNAASPAKVHIKGNYEQHAEEVPKPQMIIGLKWGENQA